MNKFRAYRIFDDRGKSQGRFVELTLDDLDAGDVLIRVLYSSVNYKDALAATGAGRVIRRFPCVGGVDAAATRMPLRKMIWQRLANDLRPLHLLDIIQQVSLADLAQVFPAMIAGRSRGRTVVEIAAA